MPSLIRNYSWAVLVF